jgi:hypothetical protein
VTAEKQNRNMDKIAGIQAVEKAAERTGMLAAAAEVETFIYSERTLDTPEKND